MDVSKLVVALNSLQPIIVINTSEEARFRLMLFTAISKADFARTVTRISPSSILRWEPGNWEKAEELSMADNGIGNLLKDFRESRIPAEDGDDDERTPEPKPEILWLANLDYVFNMPADGNTTWVDRFMEAAMDCMSKVGKHLLFTGTNLVVPELLKPYTEVIDMPLPTEEELDDLCQHIIARYKEAKSKVKIDGQALNQFIKNCKGLTEIEAQQAFGTVVASYVNFTDKAPSVALARKTQRVKQSGILECRPVKRTLADIGGCERVKEYISEIAPDFNNPEESLKLGIYPPKGLALFGPPGTGKSLFVEAIAGELKIFYMLFSIGNMMDKLQGESEGKLRSAFKLMEANAPCVVQFDEAEKMLGSSDMHNSTFPIMKGMLLDWLQTKPHGIFVVMTANNVKVFNDETNSALIRAGRVDKVFFVDLPAQKARADILSIHLKKTGHPMEASELMKIKSSGKLLVDMTRGFSGGEIEVMIQEALRIMRKAGAKHPTHEHLCEAALRIKPQSVTMKESIDGIRSWVREGRCESAGELFDEGTGGTMVVKSADSRLKNVPAQKS